MAPSQERYRGRKESQVRHKDLKHNRTISATAICCYSVLSFKSQKRSQQQLSAAMPSTLFLSLCMYACVSLS
ncbi:MAG: hypothetical protein ACK56F_31440, partial [bacterium]